MTYTDVLWFSLTITGLTDDGAFDRRLTLARLLSARISDAALGFDGVQLEQGEHGEGLFQAAQARAG